MSYGKMNNRGVCTSSNGNLTELDSNRSICPEARSTPYCGTGDAHRPPDSARHTEGIDVAMSNNHSPDITDTARSSQPNDSSCSSAVIYKMKAHGNRGDRSPTRIEFNRVERVRQPKGCFLFRQNETRFKLSKPSSLAGKMPSKTIEMNNKEKKRYATLNRTIEIGSKQKKETFDNIELYYFDHGNSGYFCTTDCPPQLSSDRIVRQTSDCANKFWAELYGSIHIVVAIIIAFFLQTIRFLMYSVVRPLTVGLLQIIADYGIKPLFTAAFNGFLQPPLILGVNVFNSLADMLEPLARSLGHFFKPLADLLQSIRLVEISHYHNHCYTKDDIEAVSGVEQQQRARPDDA